MTAENLQVMAGMLSTLLFMVGTLPMLLKAWRTKDLHSYSLTNMVLSNVGNLIHWVYVVSLPFGPVWLLHSFYTLTMVLMLVWYLSYNYARHA